jgi:molecular chaperone GrpE
MSPSSDKPGNSGATPASSAPDASAEESGATPEVAADGAAPADLPAEEGLEAEVEVPEAEPTEHERQLERDLDELSAKAEKADEYLELAQRTRADFENYRKRAAREAAAAQERGVVKLVRELLPAVDNLDRALEAAGAAEASNNGDELVSGIKLVHAELIAALARAGVERFSPEGERFDPQCHEAVGQHKVDGTEAGMIIEVYQRGYRLGDSVIRPARVLVAG